MMTLNNNGDDRSLDFHFTEEEKLYIKTLKITNIKSIGYGANGIRSVPDVLQCLCKKLSDNDSFIQI